MNNLKLPSLVASIYTCSSISLDFACFGLVSETGSLCSPGWPPAQRDVSTCAAKLVLGLKACATTITVLRQLRVAEDDFELQILVYEVLVIEPRDL